ncbi:uncharacterized protein LOC108678833 [Hyalella azteca]|uniref:Uncharacterized protein LOC108678833 n=1 Tax=Hyalella azteca TaxID=294128 RepID=A0A8B7PAN6_HYAAZ|nr:uncharacterized protein LOC108678833 [Hyalella azteca]
MLFVPSGLEARTPVSHGRVKPGVKMLMETKAHMDYWSVEHFCGRWTLRTGALFIASITAVWSLTSVQWFVAMQFCDRKEGQEACWIIPKPEVQTINRMSPENAQKIQHYLIICLIVYHALYFIFSLMVFTGVYKKVPTLLSPWVGMTNIHMMLVFVDLLLTLAFTTLLHLLITLAHFVAALCAWVVVKSHRQQLRVLRSRPPIPDNALLDYTVDGVDKIALDPVP